MAAKQLIVIGLWHLPDDVPEPGNKTGDKEFFRAEWTRSSTRVWRVPTAIIVIER